MEPRPPGAARPIRAGGRTYNRRKPGHPSNGAGNGSRGKAGLPLLNLSKVKQGWENDHTSSSQHPYRMRNYLTARHMLSGENNRVQGNGPLKLTPRPPGVSGSQSHRNNVVVRDLPSSRKNSADDLKRAAAKIEKEEAAAAAKAEAAKEGPLALPKSISDTPSGQVNTGPMTPGQALRLYANNITPYEQAEVLDYPEVYFIGATSKKTRATPGGPNNCGYDDERGDYHLVMHDHIAYRYETLEVLGKGSFGQVVKAYDYKTNQMCALKIIRNKKRFHHQALVEVKILEHIRDCDPDDTSSIIHLKDHFYFRNHLCITFELLSINLYEFIKLNNYNGFTLGLIRRFAIQILHSLRFLYNYRVIHCDLKPENILLKHPTKSGIKVIDLGSSCYENDRVYTYIQSRFYRSPEVVLGIPYGSPIDMWSFGCILAELYTGYPLFPGENEVEQLLCIQEVLGVPPRHLLEKAKRRKQFFDNGGNPKIVPNSRGKRRQPNSKTLASALHCDDAAFLNFLEKCLKWDPAERMTPEEALRHHWIMQAMPPMRGGRQVSKKKESSSTHLPQIDPS